MDTQCNLPAPELFRPHPNLGDAVNHNFIASEVEGGVFLDRRERFRVHGVQTEGLLHASLESHCGLRCSSCRFARGGVWQ